MKCDKRASFYNTWTNERTRTHTRTHQSKSNWKVSSVYHSIKCFLCYRDIHFMNFVALPVHAVVSRSLHVQYEEAFFDGKSGLLKKTVEPIKLSILSRAKMKWSCIRKKKFSATINIGDFKRSTEQTNKTNETIHITDISNYLTAVDRTQNQKCMHTHTNNMQLNWRSACDSVRVRPLHRTISSAIQCHCTEMHCISLPTANSCCIEIYFDCLRTTTATTTLTTCSAHFTVSKEYQ